MELEVLRLAHFAYFLEASLAINLAFGLLEKFRDGKFLLSRVKRSYVSEPNGPSLPGSAIDDLDRQREEFETTWRDHIIQTMAWFAWWAYAAVAVSYALLITIGFDYSISIPGLSTDIALIPNLSSTACASIMVFILGGPFPLALAWLVVDFLIHQFKVGSRNDNENRVIKAIINSKLKKE